MLVGGAVRDRLLGVTPGDRDFLVTETTEHELIQNGFKKVGKGHVVYLHPHTNEEYTITHHIRSDLLRRDLTLNALAMAGDQIIDPSGGIKDIKNRLLRHISAKNFYRDPLRVYRVARFKSKFPEFSIHPETLKLMKSVSYEHDFQILSKDRLGQELEKALKGENGHIFFQTLKKTHVLRVHFTELDNLSEIDFEHTMKLVERTCQQKLPNALRFAGLFSKLTHINQARKLLTRLKVSNEWMQSALVTTLFHERLKNIFQMSSADIIKMFYLIDAYRAPYLVQVLSFLARAEGRYNHACFLEECFQVSSRIDFNLLDKKLRGKDIALAMRQERQKSIETYFSMTEVRFS